MYADVYQKEDREVGLYIVPDVDHFDELNVLVDPQSAFFQKSCGMIRGKGVQS